MDEKLYYEADVKSSGDVSKVYEDAVAKNAKYYRGVSPSGKFFGWADGRHVCATDGQKWFENPNYVAPEQETDDKPLEPASDVAVADPKESDELAPADTAFDFEARIVELEKALAEKNTLLEKSAQKLEVDEKKLAEIEHAVKVIIDFIKEV